jgi:arsenic resistance protein ArsH
MGSIIVPTRELRTLAECSHLSLSEKDDDPNTREKYRPFILGPEIESKDWISELELEAAISMAEADLEKTGSRLKVLVLYGSLRKRYHCPVYCPSPL